MRDPSVWLFDNYNDPSMGGIAWMATWCIIMIVKSR